MSLTITTNNVPRDLLCFEDLTDAERADFYYVDADEFYSPRFFRYRDRCYDVNEFEFGYLCAPNDLRSDLAGWDGFQSDTFFSGIAVRFPAENGRPDYERIIVARVYT